MAFAELVPQGWEYSPLPWRLHPLEPRFLETELPRLFTRYELYPVDPAEKLRYAVEIMEWKGTTYITTASPTTPLDRLKHVFGWL